MYVTPRWLFQSGGRRIHAFSLDVPLLNNNDGRGHAFHRTAKQRRNLEASIRVLANPRQCDLPTPLQDPVVLVVTRVIAKGRQAWDFDSIGRGSAKELIDSLVAVGWLVDDGPKYVSHVAWNQDSLTRPADEQTVVQIWSGDSYSEVR